LEFPPSRPVEQQEREQPNQQTDKNTICIHKDVPSRRFPPRTTARGEQSVGFTEEDPFLSVAQEKPSGMDYVLLP
jgi:hypothetical protein